MCLSRVHPKIVSEVLGHKEVAITLDRYSHGLPTLQAKAMARLDTVLGRAPRRRLAPAPTRPGRRARIRVQIRVQTAAPRARKGPIRAWIGPRMANLVPHTGFPVKRLMCLSRVDAVHPRDT